MFVMIVLTLCISVLLCHHHTRSVLTYMYKPMLNTSLYKLVMLECWCVSLEVWDMVYNRFPKGQIG